ncbi:MAG: transcriptional regulator [Rhodobacteraceae bacterium]|nr:transcriptional regulator [Paracoccaceae bacterium]
MKTKKQYENVLELIEVFMDENSENEELDKLATMAEAYEKKHYPMD